MQSHHRLILLLSLLAGLTACGQQQAEFGLPEGDPEVGQALFVSYNCNTCHTVAGVDLPAPEVEGPVQVMLGGRVSRLKSYAELVTSVINPSHRFSRRLRSDEVSTDGESLMTVYNDVMTVTEMVNIVAFLEAQYAELERPGYRYRTYSMDE